MWQFDQDTNKSQKDSNSECADTCQGFLWRDTLLKLPVLSDSFMTSALHKDEMCAFAHGSNRMIIDYALYFKAILPSERSLGNNTISDYKL